MVLWRLTANHKVRGDEDMVFYGQTYSPDDSISLEIGNENNGLYADFDCQLANQPNDIQRIIFTLSHEHDKLPLNSPIQLSIHQNHQCVFNTNIQLENQTAQSLLLFELLKVANGWQLRKRQQLIHANLRKLCEKLGIEVSDE